jgi:hypothetical protein
VETIAAVRRNERLVGAAVVDPSQCLRHQPCPSHLDTTSAEMPGASERVAALCGSCLCRRRHKDDLRHTYATFLVESGVHVREIAELLGHASAQIPLDRYSHIIPGAKATTAAKVASARRKAPGFRRLRCHRRVSQSVRGIVRRMSVLQLVERPGPTGYVLDVVDAPVLPAAEPVGEAQPISAGSSQLLDLASAAPSIGLRVISIHLTDRSGRPTTEAGHALEEALLSLVRRSEKVEATSILAGTAQFYVDRVSFEDPETRAVVYCTRHGLISVQGPAVEQSSKFINALLAGFRRVLGFSR